VTVHPHSWEEGDFRVATEGAQGGQRATAFGDQVAQAGGEALLDTGGGRVDEGGSGGIERVDLIAKYLTDLCFVLLDFVVSGAPPEGTGGIGIAVDDFFF